MSEEKLVPKLRFSGFDDEWKSFKLSEISKRITRKNKSLETDRPLTISAQYGLVDQIEYFNKIVASKSLKGYYLLNKGEFAYNKSYSNGYPFGAVKRLDDYENGAISTLYICFNTNDKMNSDLLKEYFETDKWHEEIYKIAVEGARNHGLLNVAVGDFFNTKHVLPTNNHEQEKIAKFLIEINTKIDLLENKHKAYQDFKKYLMQKIFAQELRFNFDDEWKQYKLKDVLTVKSSSISINQLEENTGDYPLYGASGFLKNIDFCEMDVDYISIVKDGSGVGNLSFHEKNSSIVNTSQYLLPKKNFNINFLYYLLQTINLMKYVNGSSIPHIYFKDYCIEKINIPSLDEQEKIGKLFVDVDITMENLNKNINATQEFKKGLLQQMFVVQLILSLLQNKKHI